MNQTITCPHCSKPIELTSALVSHIQKNLEIQYAQKLTLAQKKAEEKVREEVSKQTSIELTDLKKQLVEKDKKVNELLQMELGLREQTRKLEAKEKELALEVARKIDSERKKIEEETIRQVGEQQKLREMEKDKVINDLKKSLEEAQRKASQGSQQLQGEVQELDIEVKLRSVFIQDEIQPIGKGVRGADIRHIVKSNGGRVCGVILWESKRTKAWTNEWALKLKEDMRAEKANIPVIVTSVLPDGARNGIGLIDGVWVVSYQLFEVLAQLLRKNLIDIAYQKFVSSHKGEKAELLYEYVTGHAFRQQVEALVEVYQEMQTQVAKERAAFERSWKARETQLTRLLTSTAAIYGSMQGLVGSALPTVRGLELLEDEQHSDKSHSSIVLPNTSTSTEVQSK